MSPRELLEQIYGFSFPRSFEQFWKFTRCQLSDPSVTISSLLDLGLLSPFSVFQDDFDESQFNPIADSRFYDDPPEFFTLISGGMDGLHWGYWVDEGSQDEYLVVGFWARDGLEIHVAGKNLLDMARDRIEDLVEHHEEILKSTRCSEDDKTYSSKQLQLLDDASRILQGFLDDGDPEGPSRIATAMTRDRMGFVVDDEQYRPPIVDNPADGWSYEPTAEDAESLHQIGLQALDEGFPGTALKIGKDLWTYKEFGDISIDLLDKAYAALNRPIQRGMLRFRRGLDASEVDEYKEQLAEAHNPNTLNADSLSVCGENIASIPPTINQFRYIKRAMFWNNKLKSLPDELAELEQLEELDLNSNLFEEVPPVLLRMKNLKKLDLTHTPITNLPDEMSKLESLEVLWLSGNHWTEFPANVCSLPNLRELYLSDTMISAIPPDIEKLQKLETLELKTREPIASVDLAIANLRNLRKLHYEFITRDHDFVVSFPETFCELTNLESLTFSTNCPFQLPNAFDRLQSLKSLVLSNYQLEAIPTAVFSLANLRSLNITCAQIREIPIEIAKLEQLEKLDFYGNNLSAYPRELIALPNLNELRIDANDLSEEDKDILKMLLPNVDLSC